MYFLAEEGSLPLEAGGGEETDSLPEPLSSKPPLWFFTC